MIFDAGFVLKNLTPTSTNHDIVYDSAQDRFFLLEQGKKQH